MGNHGMSLRTRVPAWRWLAVLLGCAGAVLPFRMATSSPGDLDPAFGDVGRFVSLPGAAWAIEPQDNLGFIVLGGSAYTRRNIDNPRYPLWATDGFIARLVNRGELDWSVGIAAGQGGFSAGATIFDAVRQPDGKVVAVGMQGRTYASSHVLVVARVAPDGAPDLDFGTSGIARVSSYIYSAATSATLDPDGRIVVAGQGNGSNLIVLRLLPNGTFDESFASQGIYTGGAVGGFRTELIRAAEGGYRVLAHDAPGGIPRCRVLALTSNGTVDTTFGESGYASPRAPAATPVACNIMVGLPGGRILVGGASGGQAFVARLMPNGTIDPSFDASGIPGMSAVTAAAITENGDRIVLAGRGQPGAAGAMLVRLQAGGAPDLFFGDHGAAWFDVPNDGYAPGIEVHDLAILPDGAVLAAGGGAARPPYSPGPAFVARLVGDDPVIRSPGVIGILRPHIDATENSSAVVTVRRVGGRAGAIGVSYRTPAIVDNPSYTAVAGEDYTPVEGQLHWDDGDDSDRDIRVPITSDQGLPEEPEAFRLELHDTTGGGLGTFSTTVQIAPDGAPAGQIGVGIDSTSVGEANGSVQVSVQRMYYSTGRVSVTLTPKSGTATAGADFAGAPVIVTWEDGEMGTKTADIPITDDTNVEGEESFTVEASGATGGALMGPRSLASVTIFDNDPTASPDPPPVSNPPPDDSSGHSRGGGGSFGWLAGLLLVSAGCRRSAAARARRSRDRSRAPAGRGAAALPASRDSPA